MKKAHFFLILLICFHFTNNCFLLKEPTELLFIGTPHYYLNQHLKMIANIIPAAWDNLLSMKMDLLFIFSFLFTRILGCSLFIVTLVPTINFIMLIIVVYCLIGFLFDNRNTAVLAAYLVSFFPENLFYSRVYSHQMLFILLVYLTIYFIAKWFLQGNVLCLAGYVISVCLGATLIRDASIGNLFLLYISCPLVFIFKYIFKNKKSFIRYSVLIVCFVFIVLAKTFILSHKPVVDYYVKEGFLKIPYPAGLEEWVYFLSFYLGEVVNAVFIIPFVFFVILYAYMLFVPLAKKKFYGINCLDFISSLFLAFWILNILSYKQFFHIAPIITLVGILMALGIMFFKNKGTKIMVISILMITNLIYFFSFSYGYNISNFSGEKLLKEYNLKINKYDHHASCVGHCYHYFYFKYNPSFKPYNDIKAEVYEAIKAEGNLADIFITLETNKEHQYLEKTKEELAMLEYIMEYGHCYKKGSI